MLKHLIKFGGILLLLFLVACGGNNAVEAPSQPEQVEEAAPETTEDMAAEEAPANTTEVEAEVLPVGAKPQFIEFYADW